MMESTEEKEIPRESDSTPGKAETKPSEQPRQATEGEAPSKLDELEKQAAQFKDLFLRKAAEFENYKKRSESETAQIIRFANEDLLASMLPVLDDIERFLKHSKDQKDFEAFQKGIELIYQKMLKNLEGQGVKSFETVGKEFDVHYHDALLQVPRPGVAPHTVVEEVEKGYLLNDRVLRHAKVIVSASTTETGEATQVPPESEKKD